MLWLVVVFDVIVCINMIYILLWVCIDVLFVGVLCVLWLGGVLFLYGLYCCEGWYMVLLNEVFDQQLCSCDLLWGVCDLEIVVVFGFDFGFDCIEVVEMLVNNLGVVFWCLLYVE